MKTCLSAASVPALFVSWLFLPAEARAEDWPMWGRDKTRNLASPEKNPPTDWQNEIKDPRTGAVKNQARNIKWQAQLGSVSLGGPVVAQGLVWVGTNNYHPRDPKVKGDASVLMCFRESDGKFLYQYVSPRLKTRWQDWPSTSMAAPLIEGDRLWLTTNRCETVCLDIGPLQRREGDPHQVWKVDMIKEFGVYPASCAMALLTACSIGASYQDFIYVVTGNGVEEGYGKVPAPDAPSLVCFRKDTGKVVWKDNSPGPHILEGQWSNPLVHEINGRGQVIVEQGDGWLRSFDARTGKLIWKCDLNPKDTKTVRGHRNHGIATPVFYENRVYLGLGQPPSAGAGVPGRFYCIDATKEGDISAELETRPGKGNANPNAGIVWQFGGPTSEKEAAEIGRNYFFGRTLSSCVIQDGLVYAAELEGYLHCLDARTGKEYWIHDLKESLSGSPLWVDGRVYLATEDGNVWIFRDGKTKAEPKLIDMNEPLRSTPIFANGVLYIMSRHVLYAIRQK